MFSDREACDAFLDNAMKITKITKLQSGYYVIEIRHLETDENQVQ